MFRCRGWFLDGALGDAEKDAPRLVRCPVFVEDVVALLLAAARGTLHPALL
ncbi:hypothetical protein T484DRAFT_1796229 [Baffinella frigidus]|nr:hypothetical protein T484DRAFT_1796229 [Cryptophyta sp. CCMP2293]